MRDEAVDNRAECALPASAFSGNDNKFSFLYSCGGFYTPALCAVIKGIKTDCNHLMRTTSRCSASGLLIITKTRFKTLSIGIGHGLTQAAYFTGGVFPFLFFLERELAKWQEMGMSREEILEYVKYFTGTFAVIGIVSAIVFGIAGVYIGKLILKRHFKDME